MKIPPHGEVERAGPRRGSILCRLALLAVCPFLLALGPSTLDPQRLLCREEKGRIGHDWRGSIGAVLALDGAGYTGRMTARYLTRLGADCFGGAFEVREVSVFFSGPEETHKRICLPLEAGAPVTLLYGFADPHRGFDTRTLFSEPVRVKRPGRWNDFELTEAFTVPPGSDLVVGVEIEQEPDICPMAIARPIHRHVGRPGAYFQIVRHETIRSDGAVVWEEGDCDRSRVADAEEGLAFRVAERPCRVALPLESFQWKIRVRGERRFPDTATSSTGPSSGSRGSPES